MYTSHLTRSEKCYMQIYRVVIGSPLGSVIANKLMVELEALLVEDYVKKWRGFKDDTFVYVKNGPFSMYF